MKVRTRRQLIRATAVSAASLPFLAMAKKIRAADNDANNGLHKGEKSCFLKGTRITTPSGEREVQDLRIDDEVITLSGSKKIRWVAYQSWPKTLLPVCIAAHAIDDRTPKRNLYMSAGHCVYFKFGHLPVLIPVKYLVNDQSIREGIPSLWLSDYYHVELESHEVILAEGALVESYDGYRRDKFSNFPQYERLYGAQAELKPFAPILRYRNRSQEFGGIARSVMSKVVDVRDPIQIVHDELARRAA